MGAYDKDNSVYQGNVRDSICMFGHLGPFWCRISLESGSAQGGPNALGTSVQQLSPSATGNAQCKTRTVTNHDLLRTLHERTDQMAPLVAAAAAAAAPAAPIRPKMQCALKRPQLRW